VENQPGRPGVSVGIAVRAQAIGVYHDMLRDRIQERVPLDWR
jgi:hypothetical protein